jgi:regulator of nucleoside diphosphate kinase
MVGSTWATRRPRRLSLFRSQIMNTAAHPHRPPLLLSRLDIERIEALLEQPQFRGPNVDALRSELERAEMVEPAAMPADVITMNSTAHVRVDDAGSGAHEYELTLVYPRDADGSAHKVSVLAPVGSALLGLRVGEAIDWPMPGGRSARLQVLAIRYQPEAAGELHR